MIHDELLLELATNSTVPYLKEESKKPYGYDEIVGNLADTLGEAFSTTGTYLEDALIISEQRNIQNPTLKADLAAAIKANKAAGVWGMASGWTPEQLAKCAAFQDSAFTSPVYAVEQPVGLIKDTSVNGNHLSQPTDDTARPIYSRRVNLLNATTTLSTQNVTTVAADHQLKFSGAGSITLSGAATGTLSAGTHSITTTAGSLTLTVSGVVSSADLRLASDSNLPYQGVTTPTDYDEVGFPDFLNFDGVNDWLQTGIIDPAGATEVTLVLGVKQLREIGTFDVLFEFGPYTPDPIPGQFSVLSPNAGDQLAVYGNGTKFEYVLQTTGLPVGSRVVIAVQINLTTGWTVLRVNGLELFNTYRDYGGGVFTPQICYVGGRTATSPSKSDSYGHILKFGPVSGKTLLAYEREVRRWIK